MSDRVCSVEDCERKSEKRGWCGTHYSHWRRYGSPDNYTTERHGMTGTPEYISWQKMKERCYSINDLNYERYGERGIIVCERWKNSFKEFFEDMGKKPFPEAQIDRKDNDGNYEPSNCRWVTRKDNCRNRSTSKITKDIVIELRTKDSSGLFTRKDLADKYGITYRHLWAIVTNRVWTDV